MSNTFMSQAAKQPTENSQDHLLRVGTLVLAVWAVVLAVSTLINAMIFGSDGYNEFFTAMSMGGGDLSAFWSVVGFVGAIGIGVVGALLLARYRTQPAPRALHLTGLVAGSALLIANFALALSFEIGLGFALEYAVAPILLGGSIFGLFMSTFAFMLWQLMVIGLIAWIALSLVRLLGTPAVAAAGYAPASFATPANSATVAGWYADPQGGAALRYWDGATWTVHTQPMQASAGF